MPFLKFMKKINFEIMKNKFLIIKTNNLVQKTSTTILKIYYTTMHKSYEDYKQKYYNGSLIFTLNIVVSKVIHCII